MKGSIPLFWRTIGSRYSLQGYKCKCGQVVFPKRYLCPSCRSKLEEIVTLSGRGKLLNYTVVKVPPDGMELQIPYIMGLIELDEGPTVISEITGIEPEKLDVGERLRLAFRKYGSESSDSVIVYGYKFIPENYPKIGPDS